MNLHQRAALAQPRTMRQRKPTPCNQNGQKSLARFRISPTRRSLCDRYHRQKRYKPEISTWRQIRVSRDNRLAHKLPLIRFYSSMRLQTFTGFMVVLARLMASPIDAESRHGKRSDSSFWIRFPSGIHCNLLEDDSECNPFLRTLICVVFTVKQADRSRIWVSLFVVLLTVD